MLRADVRTVIIPDQAIYERLDKEIPRYPLMLDEGELVFIALVPAGTTLTFVEAEDGNTTITLSQQRQYPHL